MKKILFTILTISLLLVGCETRSETPTMERPNPSATATPSPTETPVATSQPDQSSEPLESDEPEENLADILSLEVFGSSELDSSIIRILMTLENPTDESLQVGQGFYIEKKQEDGSYVRLTPPAGDVYGILDTASYQYPIPPENTGEIGAYIGALAVTNPETGATLIPEGDYRIYITIDDTDIFTEFSVTGSPEASSLGSLINVSAQHQFYPNDTEEITLYINNRTDQELAYSPYPGLEYLNNDSGNWEMVTTISDGSVPAIAAIAPANKTTTGTVSLSDYEKPLASGSYRLVYSFIPNEFHYGFFMVE